MSLFRTSLRISACMALTNGYKAPFPTRAQERVYDSRLDPLMGLEGLDLVPTIIVTAEDHQGENLSPTSGGPPFANIIDLTFDLSVGMNKDNAFAYAIDSEPELEAALDHMEEQVKWALYYDPNNAWGARFRTIAIRTEGWRSSVYREREANVRLSARQIIAQIRCHPDDQRVLGGEGIAEPLGPLLTAIIADGGPYAVTAQAIEDMLGGSPTVAPLPLLTKIRLIEADHAATDEDEEGPAGNRAAGVAQANLE